MKADGKKASEPVDEVCLSYWFLAGVREYDTHIIST